MRYLCALIVFFGVTSGRIVDHVTGDVNDYSDDLDFSPDAVGDSLDDIVKPPFRYAIRRTYGAGFPNGEIPYVLDPKFKDWQVETLKEKMRLMENYTKSGNTFCIKFRPKRNNDRYFLNIITSDGVCNSYVGRQGGSTDVRLANHCISGAVIHELMHALGFFHEHNRDDRDNYVAVDWPRIDKGSHTAYQITYRGTNQSIPYDFGSAVHYTKGLIPKNDNYIGGRRYALFLEMSKYDVLRIQRFYSCQENNTEYLSTFKDKLLVDCSFEKDMCGMTQDKERTHFDWKRGKAPEGSRSVRGYYLYAEAKNHQGQTAALRSRVMEKGCYIFSIAYDRHRLGASDGNTLLMGVFYSDINIYNPLRTYRSLSPTGTKWYVTRRKLYRAGAPWYLSIQATIGKNSTTDVMIDDVIVQKC